MLVVASGAFIMKIWFVIYTYKLCFWFILMNHVDIIANHGIGAGNIGNVLFAIYILCFLEMSHFGSWSVLSVGRQTDCLWPSFVITLLKMDLLSWLWGRDGRWCIIDYVMQELVLHVVVPDSFSDVDLPTLLLRSPLWSTEVFFDKGDGFIAWQQAALRWPPFAMKLPKAGMSCWLYSGGGDVELHVVQIGTNYFPSLWWLEGLDEIYFFFFLGVPCASSFSNNQKQCACTIGSLHAFPP